MSALDPVYTDIASDRREPRPQAYVNVIGQGDNVTYEVPLHMQGQHVTRSADSVGGVNDKDGVNLTINEAYGLIG